MQELSTVLTSLSIAAGLALGVERILEMFKHIMEFDDGTSDKGGDDPAARAKKAMENLKAALDDMAAGDENPAKDQTSEQIPAASDARVVDTELSPADTESNEKYPAPQIPVISATKQSPFTAAKFVFLQLAGAGLGMILAYLFDLGLLQIFLQGYGYNTASQLFISLDIVFTGVVIGGGSQPIHVLIRFLTERKVTVDEKTLQQQQPIAQKITAAAVVETPKTEADEFAWKDIDYHGGVNREKLENAHRRPGEPNLIVYHHTAMSSRTSFQDIVDEFLVTKKWMTGYHCVIMPDGAIRPFCRWDRTGNHAKGKNSRSLGISFHGNFQTEPSDKFSNADGRYGNQAPTEAQLRAGARVVALWAYLYDDIKLDFKRSILPHREVMRKGYTVCPGSNFPIEKYQSLIRNFHEAWAESDIAQKQIEQFKKSDYIYAT